MTHDDQPQPVVFDEAAAFAKIAEGATHISTVTEQAAASFMKKDDYDLARKLRNVAVICREITATVEKIRAADAMRARRSPFPVT